MSKCVEGVHSLRVRDVAVIAALPFAVGLPFLWVQFALFGPSGPMLPLLTSRFHLGADALTAVTMTLYCLLLALALFVGDRFLRRGIIKKEN